MMMLASKTTRAAIVSATILVTATTGALADCKVVDDAAVGRVVAFFAASTVCPYAKKKMPDSLVWWLLDESGGTTGVVNATKGAKAEADACINQVVTPLINAKLDVLRERGAESICLAVRKVLDSQKVLKDMFEKLEVFEP